MKQHLLKGSGAGRAELRGVGDWSCRAAWPYTLSSDRCLEPVYAATEPLGVSTGDI